MKLYGETWRKPFILHDLQAVKPIIKCEVILAFVKVTLSHSSRLLTNVKYLLVNCL